MNLIDAIKSGKRFRRIGFTSYFEPQIFDRYYSHDEVLAEDWEVQSEAVTITEQQFNIAVQRTLHEMDPDEHGFFDKLMKNIGL